MGQSDLDLLIEMGFERPRAELAVKKTGGLQGALTWLEDNQDKPLEELQAAQASSAKDDEDNEGAEPSIAALQEGEQAMSLVCNECGKKFRTQDQASFHAAKTEHTDFSESTEEVKPLTEEEKKARLEEMRKRLAEKRAGQAIKDKEDAKRNEQIRMKSTRETQDMKDELKRKEQLKEAAKKRQEKLDDLEAKKRIKARIEADKAERKRKEEQARALREDRAPAEPAAPAAAPAAAAKAAGASHSEARLRLQTVNGNVTKTYPADTTLFEVAQQLETEHGTGAVASFTTTYPKKTFENGIDFGKTLREAGLTPSAVLIVK